MSETAIFKISPFSPVHQAGGSQLPDSLVQMHPHTGQKPIRPHGRPPLGIPSQDDEQGGKHRQPAVQPGGAPTIPAQDNSNNAPKPISPIWERFPIMLASVETNNAPLSARRCAVAAWSWPVWNKRTVYARRIPPLLSAPDWPVLLPDGGTAPASRISVSWVPLWEIRPFSST